LLIQFFLFFNGLILSISEDGSLLYEEASFFGSVSEKKRVREEEASDPNKTPDVVPTTSVVKKFAQMNVAKGQDDDELWDWGFKERKRLAVTVRQFLAILGLPHEKPEYVFRMYQERTPDRRIGMEKLILEKLEGVFGKDLKEQTILLKSASPKEIVEDIFYNNHDWMIEKAGIEELFFREEKGETVCSLLLKGDGTVGHKNALDALHTKLQGKGCDSITFTVFKSKYLAANPSCVLGHSQGTAFRISEIAGITAKHVVRDDNRSVLWHPNQRIFSCGKFELKNQEEFLVVGENYLPVIPRLDVALFSIHSYYLKVRSGYDCSVRRSVKWKENAFAAHGAEVWKNGAVTGITKGRLFELDEGLSYFIVQSSIFGPFALHGDSGSLVLNENNEVIGIVVQTVGLSEIEGEQVICIRTSSFQGYLLDIGIKLKK
jgi:hypothetical protein